MSHPYLNSYYPPMPALTITIFCPGESLRTGPLTAIVDTGADGSMIPQSLLDQVEAPFVDDARISSHWGEWRNVQIFTVDVEVNGYRFPAIEVVGDEEGSEIILGRSFLNKLHLSLNGPALTSELSR
ncbi:MAG: retroviral-like aspartic protease family protein [Caldilineaceae bacterium]|nr:retroviral-like aspartic protease family protein [Caldilineaceae bacterium]MCB0110419.1 retroviral-like aspartic protease family protein [Caldilineaceae bacterium]